MNAEFCDTNVFAYAYDAASVVKQERAIRLVDRLWHSQAGAVSIQILQELYVTLTRKIPQPLDIPQARSIVRDLRDWTVIEPTHDDVLAAIDGASRWNISYWDASMLTAAIRAGATVAWTEDLNDGQRYDAVVVRNPFADTAPL